MIVNSKAAGVGVLSLSPASGNISLGSTLNVTVFEDSATTQVNSFEADFSYDQTKLQYVSTDVSASPFTLTVLNDGGNGTVTISAGSTTGVVGKQAVAVVSFNVIGLGSTSLSFLNSSGIAEVATATNILGTSNGATYNIVDTTAPSTPSAVTAGATTATSIPMSWTASSDNVGVSGYNIYRNGTKIGSSTTTNYTDSGLSPSTSYTYRVSAYDAAGNTSPQSTAKAISTLPDTTAPSTPVGLSMASNTLTSVTLAWTASTDNVGVTGYNIFRNGTKVGTSSATGYSDTGLTPGTSYSYRVSAYDAAGNTSAQSAASSFSTVADTAAPTTPGGLSSTNQTTTSIDLTWTSSTDNVGVAGYNVFRNGTKVATRTVTNYSDTGLTPGVSYTYTVSASDAAGNTSPLSGALAVKTVLVPGDANNDGHVDYLDLSIMASTYQSTTDLRADFNGDGKVDFLDLSILAYNYGR